MINITIGFVIGVLFIFSILIYNDNKSSMKFKKIKNNKKKMLKGIPKNTVFINKFNYLKKYSNTSVFLFNGIKIYQKNSFFSMVDSNFGDAFYFYNENDELYQLSKSFNKDGKIHLRHFVNGSNKEPLFYANINLEVINKIY